MNKPNFPVTDLQKAIASSGNQAARCGHDFVGIEHLLLATLDDEHNAASQCLSRLGCDLDRLTQALEHTLEPGTKTVGDACLPLTKAAERALKDAMLEAHGYDRDTEDAALTGFFQAWQQGQLRAFPDTRDLLLALLRDEDSVVSQLLAKHWLIDYSQVRREN